MSGVSFPGPGQDGEQPLPGVPAWDEAADDFDLDAEMARFLGIVTEAGGQDPAARAHARPGSLANSQRLRRGGLR
jgi:hypothetical protein